MSAASVVREYGEAFRHDWSDVDGRSVRADMGVIADWLEAPPLYPGDDQARARLCICPHGRGHWSGWCDDNCEARR